MILSAIAPGIGGVLVRGEKGTAKTTVVRGLGPLLPATGGSVRVVELPIGATEDRVIDRWTSRVSCATVRPSSPRSARPGRWRVLYIDEVNLLADHPSTSRSTPRHRAGDDRARRGVAHPGRELRPRRNDEPRRSELRPQLLDRFGLAADVAAPTDVEQRVAVVERRMAFDADPAGFVAGFADEEQLLAERIAAARDR